METSEKVDILENHIYEIDNEVLITLLHDQTTGKNILWCTDNYRSNGAGYSATRQMKIEQITGENGLTIKPRTKKSAAEKKVRIKEKAEVFTPSWVCNHQNNLVDDIWFGKRNIFNREKDGHMWITFKRKIPFGELKWQDYVLNERIEIACGEAPYIVSRYDTVTGKVIEPINRIGILDRKIRVVNENTTTRDEWIDWIIKAYQSTYGYEWQGDSLLIARENLLYTFIDYYKTRFKKEPETELLQKIATIISWNIWQMDGLKNVVPMSCKKELVGYNLFGEKIEKGCPGCSEHNIHKHNGKYCKITDWQKNKVILYDDLIGDTNL